MWNDLENKVILYAEVVFLSDHTNVANLLNKNLFNHDDQRGE